MRIENVNLEKLNVRQHREQKIERPLTNQMARPAEGLQVQSKTDLRKNPMEELNVGCKIPRTMIFRNEGTAGERIIILLCARHPELPT